MKRSASRCRCSSRQICRMRSRQYLAASAEASASGTVMKPCAAARTAPSVEISLTVSPIRGYDGTIVGASKIARDITDRRRALEQQQLLLREMNHRVKNLFSLAGSIVTLSARSATTAQELFAASPSATVCWRLRRRTSSRSEILRASTPPITRQRCTP